MFKASAPGSLMLLGEYAVLEGYPALVCAIDRRIEVSIRPRADQQIKIISQLAIHTTNIFQLQDHPKLRFVMTVLKYYQSYFTQGCDITIRGEFSDQLGFASSAATTVATLVALQAWLGIKLSISQLIETARDIVRTVQGVGSGADVAACVLGGMISYEAEPLRFEPFATTFPLTVVYSGSKTSTPEAIKKVQANFHHAPNNYQQILKEIGECASQGIEAVRIQDKIILGDQMTKQQKKMESLGVMTPNLQKILTYLVSQPNLHGVKVSGSGFGDCIVALGELKPEAILSIQKPFQPIQVKIAAEGVKCLN